MQANTFKRALCAGAMILAGLLPFAAQAERGSTTPKRPPSAAVVPQNRQRNAL